MSIGWTNEETFRFIDLYRNEPAIWNPRHKYHKDKHKINDAWDRISAEMNVSVESLKKKKETLMTSFRVNYKKKQASLKCGDPLDVVSPIWIFYEPMAEFLAELYDNKNNSYLDDGASSSVTYQEKWKSEVESGVKELYDEDSLQEDQPVARKRRRNKSAEYLIVQGKPEQDRMAVYENTLADTMTKLANVMNIVSTEIVNRDRSSDNEDECGLYGRLVAIKLRGMPVTDRRELMYNIDSLIRRKRFESEDS